MKFRRVVTPITKTVAAISATVLVALVLPGCGTATKPIAVLRPSVEGPALRYIAIGASESVGVGSEAPLRDAWPKVFWATGLPRRTAFVDLAISGSTTAEALKQQLPEAVAEKPDIVTVWLNVNDLIADVSPGDYERELLTLLTGLRRNGATQVLVANTPPLDQLPAYLALSRKGTIPENNPFAGKPLPDTAQVISEVDAYNVVISRVARETGSTMVDLHAAGMEARQDGDADSLISSDGFHPSTKGHAEVAKRFLAQLKPLQ